MGPGNRAMKGPTYDDNDRTSIISFPTSSASSRATSSSEGSSARVARPETRAMVSAIEEAEAAPGFGLGLGFLGRGRFFMMAGLACGGCERFGWLVGCWLVGMVGNDAHTSSGR